MLFSIISNTVLIINSICLFGNNQITRWKADEIDRVQSNGTESDWTNSNYINEQIRCLIVISEITSQDKNLSGNLVIIHRNRTIHFYRKIFSRILCVPNRRTSKRNFSSPKQIRKSLKRESRLVFQEFVWGYQNSVWRSSD